MKLDKKELIREFVNKFVVSQETLQSEYEIALEHMEKFAKGMEKFLNKYKEIDKDLKDAHILQVFISVIAGMCIQVGMSKEIYLLLLESQYETVSKTLAEEGVK